MSGPFSLRSIVRGIEQSPPASEGFCIDDYFTVDSSGNIRYTGPSDGPMFTVLELHRFLADRFDDADMMVHPMPTDRLTDEIITFHSDIKLDPNIPQHLTGGALIHGEDTWVHIGDISDE
jgi:hypothetical protein